MLCYHPFIAGKGEGSSMKKKDKEMEKRLQKRKSLRWGMVKMLLFGWFFPLIIMIFMMIFLVTEKIDDQIQRVVMTSTDKAAEIVKIQLEASETASKNASYLAVIRNAYDTYRKDGDKRDFQNNVFTFLNQQYRFDSNCRDVILVFTEYPEESFFTFNNSKNGTYKDIEFFKNNIQDNLLARVEELDTNTELLGCQGRIYMVRNLVDAKFRPYAVLTMELDKASIMRSFSSVWGYQDANIYMNGELLLSSSGNLNAMQYDEDIQSRLSDKSLLFKQGNGESSFIYKRMKLYNGNLDMEIRLDNAIIYAELQTMRYFFIMLVIFMIPLVYLIVTFFHRRVTKPVQKMVKVFDEVKNGEYGVQIENVADSEEFYHMEESFNHMSSQLKRQFDKIYQEEIALRDAKIMALQSQINPHFLNNTLEIINWEARLNENYKVSQMIEALSIMLEATMNRKAQPYNTVAEEIVYVDAYLYIISQRFGEKFQCKKEIDETLLNCKIPRLIVQPIVENAVEHGMDVTRQGEVLIRIYRKEEALLCIEIEDNGTLSEEDKRKIDTLLNNEVDSSNEKSVSLGIRNVNQRLKMLYGETCGLFIKNNQKNHTVSTILVKMNEETEQ